MNIKNYTLKLYSIFFIFYLLHSCKSNNDKNIKETVITVESIKNEINKSDDTLKHYYKQLMNNKISQIHPNYYINATQNYLKFYRKYPKDSYAPTCLDKVQQLYTQQKQYTLALKYIDTLLNKYPNYKENSTILLNAGSMCDAILNDKNKTKYYYEMLLKSFPNIDNETKEMIQFRLKNINLSFDEMISLQNK